MKNLKQQAEEYARKFPENVRDIIAQAWLDGRNSARKKDTLDLSFVEDKYRDIFDYWLHYKRERGQTYKQAGVEACYRKLVKMSNGDPRKALDIIEQSVSNNWAGLFELKDYNHGYTSKQEANEYAFRKFMQNRERVKSGISDFAGEDKPF